MKTLLRNKRKFWYANVIGTEDIYDVHGNLTGEKRITYSDPIQYEANISVARGSTDLDPFGINVNYSKTIVTDDMYLPIDKSTILWIDKIPDTNGESGEIKHDYVVSAVAKSINSLTIAIKEVSVS